MTYNTNSDALRRYREANPDKRVMVEDGFVFAPGDGYISSFENDNSAAMALVEAGYIDEGKSGWFHSK